MKKISNKNIYVKNPETGDYESIVGFQGESAYDAAIRLGKTNLSEEKWVAEYVEKRDEAIEAIDNKGKTVLQTLPDDYVKMSSDVRQKAQAIYVDASGDMVHITDGAEGMPVQSLITHVEPKETGEGEKSPANPWTIIGWDEVKAQRVQKNVADTSPGRVHSGYYTDKEGAISANANAVRVDAIPVMPGTTYTISSNLEIYSVWFGQGDKRTNRKGVPSGNKVTVTTKANENRLYITLRNTSGEADITAFEWLQVELGSTVTAYEPYQGQTLTAALPETVYGGTLDWTTGLVTVNKAVYNLTNASLKKLTDKKVFYCSVPADMLPASGWGNNDNPVCSHYVYQPTGTMADGSFKVSDKIYIHDARFETASDFAAWISAESVTFVYPLAETYTIQLTPQQLETLKGVNNLWSNAGQTEVTYAADTKMYADGKDSTAMIGTAEPGMIATKNYASGDFIVVGKSLYKATAAIATGEAITPGTNCTATTVIEQLAAIYNLLNA